MLLVAKIASKYFKLNASDVPTIDTGEAGIVCECEPPVPPEPMLPGCPEVNTVYLVCKGLTLNALEYVTPIGDFVVYGCVWLGICVEDKVAAPALADIAGAVAETDLFAPGKQVVNPFVPPVVGVPVVTRKAQSLLPVSLTQPVGAVA